ncbi:MAG TPA: ion channel [Myxococcales bacterium]|nr:ion channel [Myxococcales bacterium]
MAQLAQDDSGIDVVNAPQDLIGDLYHVLLRAPWSRTLLAIAAMVLAVNLVFAVVFVLTGGIHGARPGSFGDAFFFSVQTVGTIGYGAMYPESLAAHLAVTLESIVAIVVAAISTGLVFSKFAVPRAKLEFARNAVLFRHDGMPTLAIRLANTRGNFIVDASVRVTFVRGETSKEGLFLYRIYDLKLVRDRTQALGRSWQVLHAIDEQSPLHGATEAGLKDQDIEINVTVIGLDGTSSQTIHGRHRYLPEDLRFGFRFEDMLRNKPDGRLELDYRKLHDLKPAAY